MQAEFRQIQIANLHFSKTAAQEERRNYFDKAGLTELANSIAAVGIAQPILVRRVQGSAHAGVKGTHFRALGKTVFSPDEVEQIEQNHFEVVAGERRVLAAKQAGLKEVPAMIGVISDEQLLELQLVENLQRLDIHPMAEAEGYEELRKLGRTAEEIADKVGKSKAYIYARMKLLELVPAARKAYYSGKLSASTALYIARVPASLQEKATKDITELRGYGDDKQAMSAREAAQHIQSEYMLRLADAGFRTDDTTLVPAAGACGACPKRTGNQPQLFGDVKSGDVCTDPICFRQKIAAHGERAIAKAQETGQKVIVGKEAEKLLKRGTDDYDLRDAGFLRLGARDHLTDKGTFRQTLGKDYVSTLLQDPKSGKLIEVAPAADVEKAHAKSGGKKSQGTNDYRAQQRAQEKKRQLELEYRARLFKATLEASIGAKGVAVDTADLKLAIEAMFARLHHDGTVRLFKVMGLEPIEKKEKYRGKVKSYDVATFLGDATTAADYWWRLRALSVAGDLEHYNNSTPDRKDRLHALASRCGVNAGKLLADLTAAAKAKAKTKAKGKKSAKPK